MQIKTVIGKFNTISGSSYALLEAKFCIFIF